MKLEIAVVVCSFSLVTILSIPPCIHNKAVAEIVAEHLPEDHYNFIQVKQPFAEIVSGSRIPAGFPNG